MCILYGEIGRHGRHCDLMYQLWRLALIAECDRGQTAVVPKVPTLQLLRRSSGASIAMLELVP